MSKRHIAVRHILCFPCVLDVEEHTKSRRIVCANFGGFLASVVSSIGNAYIHWSTVIEEYFPLEA